MKHICKLLVLLCCFQMVLAKDIVNVNKDKDEVCATFKARDGKTYTKCHGFKNTPATSQRKALLESYFEGCYRNNAWFGRGRSFLLLPGQDSLYADWICPDKLDPEPGQECGEIWDYKKQDWKPDPSCKKPKPPQPGDNKPTSPVTNPTPCGHRVNGQWIPLPCTNPDKPTNTPPGNGGGNGGNGTGNSGSTGGGSSGDGGGTPGAGAGAGDNGTGNGTGDGTDNGGTTYIPPSNPPKPPTKPPTKKSHVRIYVSQWGGPGEGSYKQYYLLPRSCLDTTQFAQRTNCDWGYKVKICGAYMSLPKDTNGYCHKWTTVSPAYGEDFVDGDTSIDTDDSGNVTINNITINNNYGNAASSQPANPSDDDLPKLDKGKVTPGRGTLGSNNNGHIGGGGNGSTAGNNGTTGNDGGNAAGNGSAGGGNAGAAPNGATGNTSGTPDGNCTPGTVGCTTMGGMGDVDAAINGNGDIGGGIGDGIGRHDVDISQVGKAGYFVEQGTCPAPKRFTAMRATHEFNYQPVCDAVAKLRPIVIVSALLVAFGIARAAIIRNT